MKLQKKLNAQIVAFVLFVFFALNEVIYIYDFWGIVNALGIVAIAVGILLGNTKIVTLGAGVELSLQIVNIIERFTSKAIHSVSLGDLSIHDDTVSRVIMIVTSCIWVFFWAFFMIATIKTNKAKRYCITAVVFYFAYCVISSVLLNIVRKSLGYSGIETYGLYTYSIVVCIAVIFAGIAMQAGLKNITASIPKHNKRIEPASQPKYENLTKLKELLDSGAITQEEFDAKKKQILGL